MKGLERIANFSLDRHKKIFFEQSIIQKKSEKTIFNINQLIYVFHGHWFDTVLNDNCFFFWFRFRQNHTIFSTSETTNRTQNVASLQSQAQIVINLTRRHWLFHKIPKETINCTASYHIVSASWITETLFVLIKCRIWIIYENKIAMNSLVCIACSLFLFV